MQMRQTRRRLLTTLSLAGAASLVRAPRALPADGLLETLNVRIAGPPGGICIAPQLVADDLLRAEGFTDIRYVETAEGIPLPNPVGRGEVDFSLGFAVALIAAIDAGAPITVLAGVHAGCTELFGNDGVRSVADLRGRKVGREWSPGMPLILMAAQVGLDPARDIHWVTDPSLNPLELFAEGKIDAFLAVPPEPQELRARHAGHVIVNTTVDRPWSQYFCCMLAGNSEYVRKYPVATKRVLRAILKATDFCASEPARAARRLVDRGFTARYDYAVQTLNESAYDKWREFDSEDTLRFYALRMYEVGSIKSSPGKIIAEGTNWRFLNELKHELKA